MAKSSKNPGVILKTGRDKSVRNFHPWIFSGAVDRITGHPLIGETVEIRNADGALLGHGAYSPKSQIRVRAWSFDPETAITPDFFRRRIEQAVSLRADLLSDPSLSACRLVNAESDGLPGIVIDRYGPFLSCQFLTAGAEYWKHEIAAILKDLIPCEGIYERSDAEVRPKEGLHPATGVLWGAEPPELLQIREGDVQLLVDIAHGHKTGYYLDQRENRHLVGTYAADKEMLNCFSYTGGFSVHALHHGARHVTNIDTSKSVLDIAAENIRLNGLDESRADQVPGDVFKLLRSYRDAARSFDLIVLDPPKFAESKAQLDGACRGYKDINLLAFKLLRPGGMLFTFSCSGLMVPSLFNKIVADAALDAGRDARIIRRLSQAPDHPTSTAFPEGNYLKGLAVRVL